MSIAGAPTIADLARRADPPVPYMTMYKRLLRTHEADRKRAEAGKRAFVPWLYRFPVSRWRVNESRLRQMHPEYYNVRPIEDIDSDIRRIKKQLEVVDERGRAVAKRMASGGGR